MNNYYMTNHSKVVNPRDILFIDGERTYPMGSDNSRRWMELSIIDGTGASVFHDYFYPGVEIGYRFSKKGLTDELLMFKPTFESRWLDIKHHLKGKHVVAWAMHLEKAHFPEELAFCPRLHCAQERFSPLVGDYSIYYGNYRSIGMWDAFDMLGLPQPPGHRHRAATDTMAMLMIWNWLEETQISNLLLSSRPGNGPIHYN